MIEERSERVEITLFR